jgi:hypothetical protein
MEEEKQAVLKVLLNATKTVLNTEVNTMDSLHIDHDTSDYNIKIEITKR